MTRETILGCGLQVNHATRIKVTFCAGCFNMLPSQLKCGLIMIEVIAVTIDTIMARETICPKGEDVCLGEDNIHIAVTGLAGV